MDNEMIQEEPAIVGSRSETQTVSDRATTGESTEKVAQVAKKIEKEIVEHIVEVRVAIHNSQPQVLEGARRTLSPLGTKGNINWGTPPEIMEKLKFATEEYLEDFNMVLTHKTQRFDVNIPEQLFKLNFLKTQPDVANSAKLITSKTSHVIWDEVTEAVDSNKKFDSLFQAYGYIKDMSEAEKAMFCRLFSVKTYRISPDLVMKRLREQADNDPLEFCRTFEDHNKVHRMNLLEYVEHGVVRKEKLAFFFGEIMLGSNEVLSVEYIKDPQNQDIKGALVRALHQAKR